MKDNTGFIIGAIVFGLLLLSSTQNNKVGFPPDCNNASTVSTCVCYQGDRQTDLSGGSAIYSCKNISTTR